jgi:hypothetical protein
VKTTAIDPCNRSGRLSVSRLVVVNGAGEARERIELDGVVRLVVSSPFGPLAGAAVSIGPDVDEPPVAPQPRLPGRPVPPAMSSGRCSGTTDAEGRVSFTHVPPGLIRIDIRSGNSTYQRHATARGFGPELAFDIPAGFLQVQVTDGSTGRPVVNASITWNGRGYRAQTSSNGTGAALLEGVGDGEGTIEVVARGFATDRTKVSTESAIHEVSLVPDPPTQRRVRVVGPTGAPVPNAIVELLPPTAYEIAPITVTDGAGGVLFTGAPAGPLSAIVSKDGFKPATVNIPANADAPVVVALTPAR